MDITYLTCPFAAQHSYSSFRKSNIWYRTYLTLQDPPKRFRPHWRKHILKEPQIFEFQETEFY